METKKNNLDDLPGPAKKFIQYMTNIQNKSINTVKQYEYDLLRMFKFLKCKKLLNIEYNEYDSEQSIDVKELDIKFISEITTEDLFDFLEHLYEHCENKPATRARKIACIRSFFNYLTLKDKSLKLNPAIELESPKLGKRLPKYLTLDEASSLLQSIDGDFKERDYAIITLFMNCGLRLAELISINTTHIRERKTYCNW